jgi:hypothetical protein
MKIPLDYDEDCAFTLEPQDNEECWACHKVDCTCDRDTMEVMDERDREDDDKNQI